MLKKRKRIYIIISVIIIICILIIVININKKKKQEELYQQEQQRVLQYSDITNFKNIEEVATYLDCTFISKEESDLENIDYILKFNLKYNLDENVKNYYENLIQYSAYILEYKSFYIIDEEKNINILVVCDSDKQSVLKYYINDIESYFERMQSINNISSYSETKAIDVDINSSELQQLILQNWKANNVQLGTVDSTYRKYDIYFDEGYEIRKVDGNIFNIIFTQKYNNEIINNITTTTNTDDVISKLGKPHFETNAFIGYKTKQFYIFFSTDQISIYPVVQQYDTEKIVDIIEKYKNSNELVKYINEIRNVWEDYDIYRYDSNYVILQYTLKGICFKYDVTAQKGVVFYNNYNGKVTPEIDIKDIIENNKELPENMYFENSDLVFEHEKARISSLDDYTQYKNYTTSKVLNISKKFKVDIDENAQVRFVSINKEFANSELKEVISYGIWYDDYNFIYSVKGRGIYKYNACTHEYSTIIQGQDTYKLTGISDDILYYDETSVNLK